MPFPTRTIRNYEVGELLGAGAQALVYKGRLKEAMVLRDGSVLSAGFEVAVKKLRPELLDTIKPESSEVKALAKLNHPNIVGYLESFVDFDIDNSGEDSLYVITEYLAGQSLRELLRQEEYREGLPWSLAQQFCLQILQALIYVEESGVNHLDLKPANIFITKESVVKLIDFGIATQNDSRTTSAVPANNLRGSFDYMAPEWVEPHFRGDACSDIYSFGICFYELLTGRLPRPKIQGGCNEFYQRWGPRADHTPVDLDLKLPQFRMFEEIHEFIRSCLREERNFRYQSFREVKDHFLKKVRFRTSIQGQHDSYRFVKWIGSGGFAHVFLGASETHGQPVAIKVCTVEQDEEDNPNANAARFVREVDILRRISHPNLVKFLDFVERPDPHRARFRTLYLVMEFLDRMPQAGLDCQIRRAGTSGTDPKVALRLFDQYLSCLQFLHEHGIIHRDFKPRNLYAPLDTPESAKVFDLSIAHDAEGRTFDPARSILGTPNYVPPEFMYGDRSRCNARSDIFAVGVTLYETLTGKLPFRGWFDTRRRPDGDTDKRWRTPSPDAWTHEIFKRFPELRPLVETAIAYNQENRFESAALMQREIREMLAAWERADEMEHLPVVEAKAAEAPTPIPPSPQSDTPKLPRPIYDQEMANVEKALLQGHHEEAVQHAHNALKLRPGDKRATELRIRARMLQDLATARSLRDSGQFSAAIEMLSQHKDSPEVEAFLTETQQQDGECRAALESAQAFLRQKEWSRAKAEAHRSLTLRKNDPAATSILDCATREENSFKAVMREARQRLADAELDQAIDAANRALALKPGDSDSVQLRDTAVAVKARYLTLLDSARRHLVERDWEQALRSITEARRLKPSDAETAKLEAESHRLGARGERNRRFRALPKAAIATGLVCVAFIWTSANIRDYLKQQRQLSDQQFAVLFIAARTAFANTNFSQARTAIERAIQLKSDAAMAVQLKKDIDIALRKENDQQSSLSLRKQLNDAWRSQDWKLAIKTADELLVLTPKDAMVTHQRQLAVTNQAHFERLLAATTINANQIADDIHTARQLIDEYRYSDASKRLANALILDPQSLDARNLLFEATNSMKAFEQALSNVIELLLKGEFDQAEFKLESAKKYGPNHPQLVLLRQNLAAKRSEFKFRTNEAYRAASASNWELAIQRIKDAKLLRESDTNLAQLMIAVNNDRQLFIDLTNRVIRAMKSREWASAAANSEMAVKKHNDFATQELRNRAMEGWKRHAVYLDALKTGTKALQQQNFTDATDQAWRALAVYPNDTNAVWLLTEGTQLPVLKIAQEKFNAGEYDKARSALSVFEQAPRFESLVRQIKDELTQIANLRIALANCEYARCEEMLPTNAVLRKKQPFKRLLEAAAKGQEEMDEMRKLADRGDWPEILNRTESDAGRRDCLKLYRLEAEAKRQEFLVERELMIVELANYLGVHLGILRNDLKNRPISDSHERQAAALKLLSTFCDVKSHRLTHAEARDRSEALELIGREFERYVDSETRRSRWQEAVEKVRRAYQDLGKK